MLVSSGPYHLPFTVVLLQVLAAALIILPRAVFCVAYFVLSIDFTNRC
jgi:hypothetical protein